MFLYSLPGMTEAKLANRILLFKQEVTAPARLAGGILLVHESMNQVKQPRDAWLYNPGQRRVPASSVLAGGRLAGCGAWGSRSRASPRATNSTSPGGSRADCRGPGQVTQSVTQLDHMTQQNAALVEQSAAAADSLRQQAMDLSQTVQRFHIHA